MVLQCLRGNYKYFFSGTQFTYYLFFFFFFSGGPDSPRRGHICGTRFTKPRRFVTSTACLRARAVGASLVSSRVRRVVAIKRHQRQRVVPDARTRVSSRSWRRRVGRTMSYVSTWAAALVYLLSYPYRVRRARDNTLSSSCGTVNRLSRRRQPYARAFRTRRPRSIASPFGLRDHRDHRDPDDASIVIVRTFPDRERRRADGAANTFPWWRRRRCADAKDTDASDVVFRNVCDVPVERLRLTKRYLDIDRTTTTLQDCLTR